MNREELKNGYYWVMPQRGYYKDKWVIATYENGMFWIHGTGEAFMPDSLTINYNKIPMTDPLPPAEGAEEILKKHMNGRAVQEYKEELFIEYNTVVAAMQEFAALHAQKLADKMVSERLREELGLYNDWLNGAARKYLTSPYIDEYLTSEYYLKTREK